jgi:hypothetical protein
MYDLPWEWKFTSILNASSSNVSLTTKLHVFLGLTVLLHVFLGLTVLLHAYCGLTVKFHASVRCHSKTLHILGLKVKLYVPFRLRVKFQVPHFNSDLSFRNVLTEAANSDYQPRHACTSVRLSTHKNDTFAGRIFMQFRTGVLLKVVNTTWFSLE